MRRFIAGTVFAALFCSYSAAVFANSGPVYWQGYPASEIMAVDANSPIGVKREDLVFDFSASEDSDYTVSGKVTATYAMVNPTGEPRRVPMAFPLAGSLDSLAPDAIAITADGRPLPYDIYIGEVVDSYRSSPGEERATRYDFAGIVNTITDATYRAVTFADAEKGKLYTIEVKPTTDQRINLTADFVFDSAKTKVLTNGFSRYERNDTKTRIAAWCYEPRVLEIFVLGEDITLDISAYTGGDLKEKTDLYTCQISAREVGIQPYLSGIMNQNFQLRSGVAVSDAQIYNLYAKALDTSFTRNTGYCPVSDLLEQENFRRVLTLVYSVEFPPDSEIEVSVSYPTMGTMDRRDTVKPLYSFDYTLNPAANWSSFADLNIVIIPPPAAPYVLESSVELARQEDKTYTAVLADLPAGDLSFTLYAHENVSITDRINGKMQQSFGPFSPLVSGVIGVLLVISVAAVIRRKKTNRYSNKYKV